MIVSCNQSNKKSAIDKDFHFTLLDKSETNINFNNKIVESDSVNFLTNQ